MELLDETVSRQHATIERVDTAYVLRVEGGQSSTWVNGDQVADHRILQNEDLLQLGQQLLRFRTFQTQLPARTLSSRVASILFSDIWNYSSFSESRPLEQVIGRNLNAFMPYGSAARRWNGLLTEIQMLFHHHPVNRMREARDQPLINSVWFWGGGCCPANARSPAAGLYASDPLTRGLAQLANATVGPVPDHAKAWLDAAGSEPDSLVVLETTRYDPADSEPGDWLEHIAELERAWFAPCRRLLQTGRLAALHLHPGNGCSYSVTSAARWRLWQRPRPLSRYFR